jgi:hypothetical protein
MCLVLTKSKNPIKAAVRTGRLLANLRGTTGLDAYRKSHSRNSPRSMNPPISSGTFKLQLGSPAVVANSRTTRPATMLERAIGPRPCRSGTTKVELGEDSVASSVGFGAGLDGPEERLRASGTRMSATLAASRMRPGRSSAAPKRITREGQPRFSLDDKANCRSVPDMNVDGQKNRTGEVR